MNFTSVNKIFEESIRKNWDRPAISNYQGVTLHYRDMARRIAKLHIVFEECGLKKGDKVVTIGGIHGTISQAKDKTVIVKVDDGTKIEFNRTAIASVFVEKNAAEISSEKTEKSEEK